MNFKASNFIIAMIVITGLFVPLTLFVSKLSSNYNVQVPKKYNETFTTLTDMTAIDDQTEALKSSVMSDEEPPKTLIGEAVDILGKYYERGYKTAQLVPQSISVYTGMIDAMLDTEISFLGTGAITIRFISVSALTIAILFLLVSALLKWWF